MQRSVPLCKRESAECALHMPSFQGNYHEETEHYTMSTPDEEPTEAAETKVAKSAPDDIVAQPARTEPAITPATSQLQLDQVSRARFLIFPILVFALSFVPWPVPVESEPLPIRVVVGNRLRPGGQHQSLASFESHFNLKCNSTHFDKVLSRHTTCTAHSPTAVLQSLSGARQPEWEGPITIPKTSCWQWRTPQEACALFEERNVALAIVGDSLMRLLAQTMGMIFSGDLEHGGMQTWVLDQEHIEFCSCEGQYDDHGGTLIAGTDHGKRESVGYKCRTSSIALVGYFGRRLCSNWTTERILFVGDVSVNHPQGQGLDMETAQKIGDFARTTHNVDRDTQFFFLMNSGLHYGTDIGPMPMIFSNALVSLVGHLSAELNMSYHPLAATIHIPGPNKPKEWIAAQGKQRVLPYNAALREWAAEQTPPIPVFDTAPVTENATSIDGTHFSTHVNTILANGLMSYIEASTRRLRRR